MKLSLKVSEKWLDFLDGLTEVNANDVEFLSSRNDDMAGGYTAPAASAPAPMAQSSGFTAVETDELPF